MPAWVYWRYDIGEMPDHPRPTIDPDPVVEAYKAGIDKTLIAVKRAAGRPKDLETVAELETIAEQASRDHGE